MITLRELLAMANEYVSKGQIDLDAEVSVHLFSEDDELRAVRARNVGCNPDDNVFFITCKG